MTLITKKGREAVLFSYFCGSIAPVNLGLFYEVPRSHSDGHTATRQVSPRRVNGPLQRPLPDNTLKSRVIRRHAGIRTRNPSKLVIVDPRLRTCGQRYQHSSCTRIQICPNFEYLYLVSSHVFPHLCRKNLCEMQFAETSKQLKNLATQTHSTNLYDTNRKFRLWKELGTT